MSPLSPHRASRLQQCLRLAAAWLALLLALQAFQGALVRGAGPLHRHGHSQFAGHAHGGFERHHHGDEARLGDAVDEALDTAAAALLAALALLATGAVLRLGTWATAPPLGRATPHWHSQAPRPPLRPPRQG